MFYLNDPCNTYNAYLQLPNGDHVIISAFRAHLSAHVTNDRVHETNTLKLKIKLRRSMYKTTMESLKNVDVVIREGSESDCNVIFQLIKDLAVYEGMLDQVKITAEGILFKFVSLISIDFEEHLNYGRLCRKGLKKDAFQTKPPLCYTVVAELLPVASMTGGADSASEKREVVGYALYYKTYSTWSGQAIHLEDFFVKPEYRFKGIGDKIFKYLAKVQSANLKCFVKDRC